MLDIRLFLVRVSGSRIFAILSMIFVICIWGFSWPIGRVVSAALPPISSSFFRFMVGVPFLFSLSYFLRSSASSKVLVKSSIESPVIDARPNPPRSVFSSMALSNLSSRYFANISLQDHLWIAVMGFFQVTLYSIFYFFGLRYTTGADASLVIGLAPLFTGIISSFIYPSDEKLSYLRIFGLMLGISGVALIFFQDIFLNTSFSRERLFGNLLIAAAAGCWTIFTISSRPLYTRIKPTTFNAWSMLYGFIFLCVLVPFEQPWNLKISFSIFLYLLYLGILSAALASVLFSNGVKILGPSRTAAFINLVPIVGVSSAILFYGEQFIWLYIFSPIFIFVGLYLVNRRK